MLITLDEAKLYLHIDSTDEDSVITGIEYNKVRNFEKA